MHRFFNKTHDKCYGDQVQETIDKPFHAEFCSTVFPGVMGDHLFPDLVIAIPFDDHWYIPVHLTIYAKVPDYF